MTYNVFGGTLNPTLLLLRPGEVILMLSVDRQLLLIDVGDAVHTAILRKHAAEL